MPIRVGVNNVQRELAGIRFGINGVNREASELYAGSNGINRLIFESGIKVTGVSATGTFWNTSVNDGYGNLDVVELPLNSNAYPSNPTTLELDRPQTSYPYMAQYKVTITLNKPIDVFGIRFVDGSGVPSIDPNAGNIISAPSLDVNGENYYFYPFGNYIPFYNLGWVTTDKIEIDVYAGTHGAGAEYLTPLTRPVKIQIQTDVDKYIDFLK